MAGPVPGVGGGSDLKPRILIDPVLGIFRLSARTGLFYQGGARRIFGSDVVTVALSIPAPGYHRFSLGSAAVSPVRAHVYWQDTGQFLFPVYNAVAIGWFPIWSIRPDGYWQASIDEVWPLRVWGHYSVPSYDRLGPGRYWLDRANGWIVSPEPAPIDGFRVRPAVMVEERVWSDDYQTVRSRYAPEPSSASASVFQDGAFHVLGIDSVDGNQWTLSDNPVIPGQAVVLRYAVPDSFCLVDDSLEVYATRAGSVVVEYETAKGEYVEDAESFELPNAPPGSYLVGISPGDVTRNHGPSASGLVPAMLQIDEPNVSVWSIPDIPIILMARVLTAEGNPVPGVPISAYGVNCTASPLDSVTDWLGECRISVQIGAGISPYQASVVVGAPGYLPNRSVPIRSSSHVDPYERHQVMFRVERLKQPDEETDLALVELFDLWGEPIVGVGGVVRVRCVSGHSISSFDGSRSGVSIDIPLDGSIVPHGVVFRVPKDPVDISIAAIGPRTIPVSDTEVTPFLDFGGESYFSNYFLEGL